MWTETTQQQYRRDGLRYASDVSDAEWVQIEGLLPVPKRLGRPRTTQNAPSCQRHALPVDDGLSVAAVAERISAIFDGTAVFLPMAGCRAMADDQSFPGDADTRGGWSRGQPHRRGPRQPVGQDHRGCRASRL